MLNKKKSPFASIDVDFDLQVCKKGILLSHITKTTDKNV